MQPVQTKYGDVEALNFPGAITLRVLLSGSQTDGNQAIFEDIVEPGIGPGRHIHHGQDETFFFLEGSFDVEIDGALYHMEPGDIGFVPRETVHAFKNVGSTPGRLRYVFSPALQMEDMFRALYQAQGDGKLTEATMAQVAKDHGQTFVGPPL
ncbi:cupin domain-containing protein [Loktanella sp. Alg231-35]|uniref:cupin domain-containing protein n=1 Tax=Loktanella sp. Alg231-35 TaxID=1922220 RepID=UPI000D54B59E|nr:cupin domain-containing protein [Loktanella sp. Alg231-35]